MIIFGKQVVLHLLKHYPSYILEFYLVKEIDKKTFSLLQAHQQEYHSALLRVDFKKAQAMARGGNHQGWLAKVLPPKPSTLSVLKSLDKLLVLCGLSDVGNVGALFRSVACLGFDGIVMDKSLPFEGLARTSMGALYEVPFCICSNPADILQTFKDVRVHCYGAHTEGQDVKEVNFKIPLAIFLGSEGAGLASKLVRRMDTLVHIGMKGKIDSLNVSVAGAILMDRAR
ncbi:TrmH family RNA methyltransferase [Helicobacter cynogastricus]|uniref:TrmH family RNA methyltransferase n=1 Tax=Helicobacter cynogastricus TaxID=329937 RepID=UPI000CF03D03|nr:TrmH family RNA methyltransferase [Helicobacter cynogastricus]